MKRKPAKVVQSKPATPKAAAPNVYSAALARVAAIVQGFAFVQNPPTQFVQREVTAKVRVQTSEAKTPVVADLHEYIPARRLDAKTGKVIEQSKRYARALLTAYSIGKVGNPRQEAINLAAYLAAKVLSSRPRSLEGVMSAQALAALESQTGLRIVDCGESDRAALDAKMAELSHYLEAGIAGGFIAAVRGKRKLGNATDLAL